MLGPRWRFTRILIASLFQQIEPSINFMISTGHPLAVGDDLVCKKGERPWNTAEL